MRITVKDQSTIKKVAVKIKIDGGYRLIGVQFPELTPYQKLQQDFFNKQMSR